MVASSFTNTGSHSSDRCKMGPIARTTCSNVISGFFSPKLSRFGRQHGVATRPSCRHGKEYFSCRDFMAQGDYSQVKWAGVETGTQIVLAQFCPEGTIDNSPAVYCWVAGTSDPCQKVPEGRPKMNRHGSTVPPGRNGVWYSRLPSDKQDYASAITAIILVLKNRDLRQRL